MENSIFTTHIAEYFHKYQYHQCITQFNNENHTDSQKDQREKEKDDINPFIIETINSHPTSPIYFFSSFSTIHAFVTNSLEEYRVRLLSRKS